MHRDLRQCRDGLRSALAGLSPSDAERSTDGKWSIAAIIDHLDLSYARTAGGIARRLDKGSPAPAKPRSLKLRLGLFAIKRLWWYPTGRTAPDVVMPRGRRFSEVLVLIDPHLMLLDQRLKEAARAWGSRRPVLDHPLLGTLSVSDWRRFHFAHTRHHIEQIRKLRT